MRDLLYITLAFSLFLGSCTSEESPLEPAVRQVELLVSVSDFTKDAIQSASNFPSTAEESSIENLYVFLFPSGSQELKKYYMDGSSFSGGTWESNKIKLDLAADEAGTRDVYLVANCSTLKAALDNVDDVGEFRAVFRNAEAPWSPGIHTPVLMVGHQSHNFIDNYRLDAVALERAVAKMQLTIRLSGKQQSVPVVGGTAQYKYRFVDFDKRTYLLKPDAKTDDLATSDWSDWSQADYELNPASGKVTALKLTTYLNERDHASATVEIVLPYEPGGLLPPPEFGDEIYKLALPQQIIRNTIYAYDVEL